MNVLILISVLIACMVWSVVVWCWKAFIVLIVFPVVFMLTLPMNIYNVYIGKKP